jgi:hypothetical protein
MEPSPRSAREESGVSDLNMRRKVGLCYVTDAGPDKPDSAWRGAWASNRPVVPTK